MENWGAVRDRLEYEAEHAVSKQHRAVIRAATALLAAKDDGQSLAEAIRKLIKDPEMRREMGANGRQFITEKRNLHHNYLELDRRLRSEVLSF